MFGRGALGVRGLIVAKDKQLVSYEAVRLGFEAVYTGDRPLEVDDETEVPVTFTADEKGRMVMEWSTWPWTWPGQEKDWDEDIRHINVMQAKLGPLDDRTRQIRAHIGSLTPCDSGFPVTVDELLGAISQGYLAAPSFHNGCWLASVWWEEKTTQPMQDQSMQAVEQIFVGYLEGKGQEELAGRFPPARRFIERTYAWLGPVATLTKLQRLMLERMLLPFEFLTKRNQDALAVHRNCFGPDGRGAQLDAEIAALAGLPKIHPDYLPQYREKLALIPDPQKKELYRVCCHIAHGLHGLSDCHHSTFRWIENWIHGIGTGQWGIPERQAGVERERLGRLLFGYVLGLDKWLLDVPMQFLLLDLGYVDLGFDPKNEILRVYAYLGEERNPVKEWLVACFWYTLMNSPLGGSPAGLVRHKELLERASQLGISLREWMGAALGAKGTE